MRYLLIMGESFLREAICSFLQAELPTVELIVAEGADEFPGMPAEERASVKLALLYAGTHDAADKDFAERFSSARSVLGEIPIVLIGERTEPLQIDRALRLGARGYIPAAASAEIVKHVLPLIASGCVFAPPFLHANIVEDPDDPAEVVANASRPHTPGVEPNGNLADAANSIFTKRENEVLKLLATGLQNKIIAHELGLKESTVKVHIRHIMRKLRVTSRTQAALIAQSRYALISGGMP